MFNFEKHDLGVIFLVSNDLSTIFLLPNNLSAPPFCKVSPQQMKCIVFHWKGFAANSGGKKFLDRQHVNFL